MGEAYIDVNINSLPDVVIEMDKQGPRGPQGPAGPSGPQGQPGPQGPQGLNTVYVGTEPPDSDIYNVWIDTDGGPNVDTEMSDTSTDPVENRVIKAYVDSKSVDTSNLATKQELSSGLAEKQDKGNYALVSEIPTLVSQLENDSDYATQTQVMQAIASIPQFSISIVNELPSVGEKMVLYLVPKAGAGSDVYDEYIWIENTSTFEFLGTTAVDLTDYVKNTDYPTTTTAGVIKKSGTTYGLNFGADGFVTTYQATDSDITAKTNQYRPITPNNLDVAVKTGITSNANTLTDTEKTTAQTWLGLDDVVRKTNLASASEAGIIKIGSGLSATAGYVVVQKASNAMITAKTNQNYPIVPSNLNYAVNSVLPTMTEAEYEALATKDENLFYMIVEE